MIAPVCVPIGPKHKKHWMLVQVPNVRCYSHIPKHGRGSKRYRSPNIEAQLRPEKKISSMSVKKPSILKRVFNYFAKRG